MPMPRPTFSREEMAEIDRANDALSTAMRLHRARIRRPNSRGYHDLHAAGLMVFDILQFARFGILPPVPDLRRRRGV